MTSRAILSIVPGFAAVLLLSACTTVLTLDYRPDAARGFRGPAVFGVGQFRDQRGMGANMVGTVGVPGISTVAEVPLTNVALSVTVEEAVHNAFTHALNHRHMLSAGRPRLMLSGEVLDLHCELFKNPYASVLLRVNLVDVGSGRVVFSREFKAERQSVFYIQGSVDPLPLMREITSRALQDAVDKAIDDPGLRAAMRQHL